MEPPQQLSLLSEEKLEEEEENGGMPLSPQRPPNEHLEQIKQLFSAEDTDEHCIFCTAPVCSPHAHALTQGEKPL